LGLGQNKNFILMRHFYRVKKHLTIAISSLIFFGLSLNVQGQLPFSDDFESGDFTAGAWTVSGSAQISSSSPYQGTYCVEGPGTYFLTKSFSPISDNIVSVEFAMKASQTTKNSVVSRIFDGNDNQASHLHFEHSGYIIARNGSGSSNNTNLIQYSANTWYFIKIVLDNTNKTYDVYIDGQLIADDFGFEDPNFTMPEKFEWHSGESNGTGWIDDVCIFAGTTGVEDLGLSLFNINVYPNPTSGILNFKSEMNQVLQIGIFNNYGQIVYSSAVLNDNSIDISRLSTGIYFVKLTDENGNILLSRKILKE